MAHFLRFCAGITGQSLHFDSHVQYGQACLALGQMGQYGLAFAEAQRQPLGGTAHSSQVSTTCAELLSFRFLFFCELPNDAELCFQVLNVGSFLSQVDIPVPLCAIAYFSSGRSWKTSCRPSRPGVLQMTFTSSLLLVLTGSLYALEAIKKGLPGLQLATFLGIVDRTISFIRLK